MEHPQLASKTWELSLYELHRAPHEVKTDDTEIVITPRSLHSELMCPICLDMLKNTMTTKECLHRFCQECIITALRSGNKECPTCRKKLVSKRSLRPDPNFDALISKIFPSRDEYDAHQERVLAKIKQSISSSSTIQNLEEGLRQQVVARSNRVRKNATEVSQPEHSHDRPSSPASLAVVATSPSTEATPGGSGTSTASTSAPHGARRSLGEVELVLQPHPDHNGSNMPTRFIKTTSNATIEHIAKYLAMRAALEDDNADHSAESLAAIESQFVIYTSSPAGETPGSLQQVPATVALSDIAERLSSGKFKTLELRYQLR